MSDRGHVGSLTELSRSLAGYRALVTGAGSGMGRATAHLLSDEGASVIVADLEPSRCGAVAAEICAVHGDDAAIAIECDITGREELEKLAKASVEWKGGLEILVNNAGVALAVQADRLDDEFESVWSKTLTTNLLAHARLVALTATHLTTSGAGRIVNIASTEARVAAPGLSAYAASKAGVEGLTRSLAVELSRKGVTVNCICPGPIDTPMTASIDPAVKEEYARRRVPLRRYGLPEEVAHVIVDLCRPSSSFVNGSVVTVDGGMTIRHT